jgi:hypothetical protein
MRTFLFSVPSRLLNSIFRSTTLFRVASALAVRYAAILSALFPRTARIKAAPMARHPNTTRASRSEAFWVNVGATPKNPMTTSRPITAYRNVPVTEDAAESIAAYIRTFLAVPSASSLESADPKRVDSSRKKPSNSFSWPAHSHGLNSSTIEPALLFESASRIMFLRDDLPLPQGP